MSADDRSDEERRRQRSERRAERQERLAAVQAEAEAAPEAVIPSPCVAICQLDETNSFCLGCLRTLEEIRDWPIMNRQERLALREDLQQRWEDRVPD